MQGQVEEKKSFWYIYAAVAAFYVIMIIVYSIVVHNATEDGAADVAPVKKDDSADPASKSIPEMVMGPLVKLFQDALVVNSQ